MSQEQVGDPSDGDGEGWAEWIEVVDDVLDTAIGREEVIECTYKDFRVDVPISMGPGSESARWELNGTVRVHVEGRRGALAEWLQWWHRKLPSGSSGTSAPSGASGAPGTSKGSERSGPSGTDGK